MRKLSTGLRKHGMSILFSMPFLVLFFIFTVIPVFMAVGLSFTQYDVLQSPKFVGIENYLMLFLEDSVFMTAFKNTMLYAIIYVPVSMVACLMIAWMINDYSPKVRTLLTFIFYMPALSGGMLTIWKLILSGDSYGVLNNVLMELGLVTSPVQWLTDPDYLFWVLVVVAIWSSLDLGFLSYIAAFRGIDEEIYEAAAMDGVKNRMQELWYITLPTLKPQMIYSALTSITGAFGVGVLSNQLFGNPSTNYAAHTMYLHLQDYTGTRMEHGVGCAIAVILFVLTVGGNKLIRLFIGKIGK